MFRHYISINALRNQYRNLYGLTVGGNIHSEPIHIAIKHIITPLSTLCKFIFSFFACYHTPFFNNFAHSPGPADGPRTDSH